MEKEEGRLHEIEELLNKYDPELQSVALVYIQFSPVRAVLMIIL